jgi:hypothetical protein
MFLCTAGTAIPVCCSVALEIMPSFFDDLSLTELCILLTLMGSLYKVSLCMFLASQYCHIQLANLQPFSMRCIAAMWSSMLVYLSIHQF